MAKTKQSKIGDGYGSECHLLRWMGRHRNQFDAKVLETLGYTATQGSSLRWEDFKFAPGTKWPDAELEGLEFLKCKSHKPVLDGWKEFWPQTGRQMNWDAVGWLSPKDGAPELVLVEAKAEAREMKSPCGARGKSRDQISETFARVQRALNVLPGSDWMKPYYQMANRIAVLWFLNKRRGVKVPTHLLNIYFYGEHDEMLNSKRKTPHAKKDWSKPIEAQHKSIGLPAGHDLKDRMHELYLPIAGK